MTFMRDEAKDHLRTVLYAYKAFQVPENEIQAIVSEGIFTSHNNDRANEALITVPSTTGVDYHETANTTGTSNCAFPIAPSRICDPDPKLVELEPPNETLAEVFTKTDNPITNKRQAHLNEHEVPVKNYIRDPKKRTRSSHQEIQLPKGGRDEYLGEKKAITELGNIATRFEEDMTENHGSKEQCARALRRRQVDDNEDDGFRPKRGRNTPYELVLMD